MNSASHPQPVVNNLQTGARVALVGMLINLAFAAAKIIGGILGNAYVLIADGIESTLDIAGSLVIWGGLKFAARPPDETHPYGHGKAEPIAAVVVAFGVLLAAAGLTIESVREILTPHHGPAPFTLGILIVVIVVKEIMFRYVIRIGHNVEVPPFKPMPGIIAVMRSPQPRHSSVFRLRSSVAKDGRARMIGPRYLRAPSSRRTASGCCDRLSTKSWTRLRADRLSEPFATRPQPCRA